jgi:PadR family transcriptional regulator, regulatory protein PadR
MAFGMKTLQLLAAMLEDQTGQHYGYDLMQKTKMMSGTLYPILAKLEDDGLLQSEVEEIDPKEAGRRARRYYVLTGHGIRVATRELNTARATLTPSFQGVL